MAWIPVTITPPPPPPTIPLAPTPPGHSQQLASLAQPATLLDVTQMPRDQVNIALAVALTQLQQLQGPNSSTSQFTSAGLSSTAPGQPGEYPPFVCLFILWSIAPNSHEHTHTCGHNRPGASRPSSAGRHGL